MKHMTMPERREGPVDPMPKQPGPSVPATNGGVKT